MSDKLADYAREMDVALRERKRFAAYNRDIHHATVAVCLGFRYAEKTVRLLSEKLDLELYGGEWFIEEAKSFLGRGGEICILVESDLDDHHPLLRIAKEHPDAVSINRVPDAVRAEYSYNYMVVDDIGYRFESDRSEPRAIVVFHSHKSRSEKMVSTLLANFSRLHAYSNQRASES